MAISSITNCDKSAESTLTTTDMLLLPPLAPKERKPVALGRKESEKDQGRRRIKAYKWYKHFVKPTKATLCSIVDYAKDIDITRQDVDLLPWNLEETKLIKEVMKSPNKTEIKDKKKDTKVKKKDKKEKEPNGSSEDTQDHLKSADQLLTIKVEEEHKRRKEERRLKREATKKSMPEVDVQDKIMARNSNEAGEEQKRKKEERQLKREDVTKNVMPEVDVQDKSTAKDTKRNITEGRPDDRLESAFQWYTRLGSPTRTKYKQKVEAVKLINVTPRDIDLLPWDLTGRAVNIEKMNAMIRASIVKQ